MTSPFTSLTEETINRILRLDPDTLARLGELDGKVIRLRLGGTDQFEIFVLPSDTGVSLRGHHDGAPDVTLAGNIPVFAKLALRRVVPDVVADGEVQISGDIDLGQRFQRLLEKIDVDGKNRRRACWRCRAHHWQRLRHWRLGPGAHWMRCEDTAETSGENVIAFAFTPRRLTGRKIAIGG
jgi:predicted lipid carrier protein YhbT